MKDVYEIDGKTFERILFCGADNLRMHLQEVNDLNVFPIPDGDTGDNMYMTLKGGIDQLKNENSCSIGEKANALAQGMLLNARGNSGVILSQLFFGLAEGLKNLSIAKLDEFIKALNCGVKRAYGSVAKPVEGTILTVARESVENAVKFVDENTSIEQFLEKFIFEMKQSLKRTPDILAVLKEAGVIDSGGAGLLYIVEGFKKAFEDGVETELAVTDVENKSNILDFSKFNENSVMEYGYCTELLLQLQTSKIDLNTFSLDKLIEFLNNIGDSIVAFKNGTVVKIHVHTLTPWMVLEYCQKFGEYLNVKIENMTLQHNETVKESDSDISSFKVKRARRKFALVTVATGEGLKTTFEDMGADYVISGGQTNNPSAEDFISAFEEVNADHVFVLPNNGNIILTAKQAADIYKDSDVRVIESKSIGEGYSALSMLDYSSNDPDLIESNLKNDCLNVLTGMVTKAVRTTCVNGVKIEKDDYIGFTDKTMHVSTKDKIQTVCALIDKLDMANKNFLIAVYGRDCKESEKTKLEQFMAEKYPQTETYSIDGGQDVYDFLLIVE